MRKLHTAIYRLLQALVAVMGLIMTDIKMGLVMSKI